MDGTLDSGSGADNWGSDNIAWMSLAVCEVVNADPAHRRAWLDRLVPYRRAPGVSETMYQHLINALAYDYLPRNVQGIGNLKPNGLLDTQGGDWLDQMQGGLAAHGESVYASALLYHATQRCLPLMTESDRSNFSQKADGLRAAIERVAVDAVTGRYVRNLLTNGTSIGSRDDGGRVFSDLAVVGLHRDLNEARVRSTVLAAYQTNSQSLSSGNLAYTPSYPGYDPNLGLYTKPGWYYDSKVWARVCALVTAALKKQGWTTQAEDNFRNCLPTRQRAGWGSPFNHLEWYDPRPGIEFSSLDPGVDPTPMAQRSFSCATDDAMAIWAHAQLVDAPSIPAVDAPACASGPYAAGISWTGTPGSGFGFYVDLATDSQFANFWNRQDADCPGTACTMTAPAGFNVYQGSPGPAELQPERTYWVRVVNGALGAPIYSPTQSFSVPACANQPPVANAGPDQLVASGAAVTLHGAGSRDPEGQGLSYRWSQIAGPTVALSSLTSPTPAFTAPTGPTSLTFQLAVSDGTFTANPTTLPAATNHPPTVTLTSPATGATFPAPATVPLAAGAADADVAAGSYSLTAVATDNAGATATSPAVRLTVTGSPAPALTFSATPTTLAPGQSSSLSWATTNATGCTAAGGWSGSQPTSGSQAVTPSRTTTYTLTCTGSGGSVSRAVTVTVPAATNQPPTVTLTSPATGATFPAPATVPLAAGAADADVAAGGTVAAAGGEPAPPRTTLVSRIVTLWERGGRVDCGPEGRLALDREGPDGYFDVYTAQADGSNERCLTCGRRDVPQRHNGNPAWHPSGAYLVLQSQDPRYPGVPGLGVVYTNPGAGLHNDLWVAASDGSRFWQLTRLGRGRGVLHPHFSHDGTRLTWAERVAGSPWPVGQWALKVARFVVDGRGPRLEEIREFRPGGFQLYETHGFSPDDRQLVFTASRDANFFHSDIYLLEFATGQLTALTDPARDEWDEHAHFLPNGEHIVWMSSQDIPQATGGAIVPVTDYWIMRRDGSAKRRLTRFNDRAAGHDENRAAADVSPDPRGGRLLAYLINRHAVRTRGPGPTVAIELERHWDAAGR